MKRAVVLLSGGLDSTTVLGLALKEGLACYPLFIDYGQRHSIEESAARRVAELYGLDLKCVGLDLRSIGGSALTDDEINVPKEESEGIPTTYVPARNTIFLSIALGYAETLEADEVHIGANAIDYSGYPDCRPEYIEAFERLAKLATRSGVEGRPIRIVAPLMRLSKPDIIRQGLDAGVDYGMTHSCYDPKPGGEACGRCDSCRIRRAAFEALGFQDPASVLSSDG